MGPVSQSPGLLHLLADEQSHMPSCQSTPSKRRHSGRKSESATVCLKIPNIPTQNTYKAASYGRKSPTTRCTKMATRTLAMLRKLPEPRQLRLALLNLTFTSSPQRHIENIGTVSFKKKGRRTKIGHSRTETIWLQMSQVTEPDQHLKVVLIPRPVSRISILYPPQRSPPSLLLRESYVGLGSFSASSHLFPLFK